MIDWRDRPVLVTGAGGFIGSHLVEALVRRGARVRGFFHYGNAGDRGLFELAPPAVQAQVEALFGDLRDAETVGRAVRGVGCVFHLGALVGIPYSYLSPRDVVETNVTGTLNVLLAAKEGEAVRVVHTSTSEVYGSARVVPMTEAHPLQAQSPYAASKIGADKLVESFHRSYGLAASTVRPFNTYGPRQSTRAIIPTIIAQALAGDVVRLGSTTPTRDLNFVTDTAAAFLSVAEADAAIGEVFNAGTGRETSVGDLVQHIGELSGRTLTVEADPQRVRPATSEVDRLVADATKLRATCGWAPSVTLEEGLRQTIEWFAAHGVGGQADRYGV